MKAIIVLIFIFYQVSFTQQKYFIYFKDKGNSINKTFLKNSQEYTLAIQSISERSVDRRKKNLPEDRIVTFEDIPINEEYVAQIESNGLKIQNKLKWLNAVTAYLNSQQLENMKKFPFVSRIEPVVTLTRNNSAELYSSNLHDKNSTNNIYGNSFKQLTLSNIPEVHSFSITGKNIIIGILDTGFDWKLHESLTNSKVIAEYDFIFKDTVTSNQSNDVSNQHNHGTYVMSIIAAKKDSVMIGASYNSHFVLAKTEDVRSETKVEEDNYAAALEWMDSIGVDISTSSLGYNDFDQGIGNYSYNDMNGKTAISTKALEIAFSKGIVTITSAGNEGNNSWKHITAPADGFNVISVGAIDAFLNRASFSSIGPTYDGRIKPEVVTLGVSVYGASASSINLYSYGQGTSCSAPIAAGIAGLLLSIYPELTNTQVRSILLSTANNSSSPNNNIGFGLLSALNAITLPNIEYKNGSCIIRQAILTKNINSKSLELSYNNNSGSFTTASMLFEKDNRYSFITSDFNKGDLIQFRISYLDSNNKKVTLPDSTNYFHFTYGDALVTRKQLYQPTNFILRQNYPNPFNGSTVITFVSIDESPAELKIYNSLGEIVKTISINNVKRGQNEVFWNGVSDNGLLQSSGVYYYSLIIKDNFFSKKMILLR
jgi:subtilisin family serine protease